jgi:hypothetical protein
MTESVISRSRTVLLQAFRGLQWQWRALIARTAGRASNDRDRLRVLRLPRSSLVRRLALVVGTLVGLCAAGTGLLWWLVSSGPVEFDIATHWFASAIEKRIGGKHKVDVGGTVLERDETGRIALRLRDIVVRDAGGTVVASAPKAEVGIHGSSLFAGQIDPARLSLIGAEMALRIEADGQVTVFAGGERQAVGPSRAAATPPSGDAPAAAPGTAPAASPAPSFAALIAWLDGLDALGHGGALTEIGLKDGTLVVDDRRSDKRLTFNKINLSLTRPREGGVALALNSTGADGPWALTMTVTPKSGGGRTVEAVLRDVSPKDVLLALRLGSGKMATDMPLSAVLRAEIEPDGTLQMVNGRVLAGAGYIGSPDKPEDRILLDEAQLGLRWNAAQRQLLVPVEIHAGASRVTVLTQFDAPAEPGKPWTFAVVRGFIALGSTEDNREPPLVLDRLAVRGQIDTANRQLTLEQGDLRGTNAGIAISGVVDYAVADPRVAFGIAGTRMSVAAFKRLWPVFVVPPVRNWVLERVSGGVVEQVEIATNAPFSTFSPEGPPIPDDGLALQIKSRGSTLRLVDSLPPLIDVEMTTRVNGRTASVTVSRATAELSSGRKLNISNGLFEVPDTFPKPPPSQTRFRVEGTAEAVAELLSVERLRDAAAGVALDPATTRGNVTAQVAMDFPLIGELNQKMMSYAIEADVTNFSAEKLINGQKLEAPNLKLYANQHGFQTRADVRIGGVPAAIEFRKLAGQPDAEVRMEAKLDDAARSRFGLGLGGGLAGPVAVKLQGRIGSGDRENRLRIETDLKDTKIVELLPGWWKQAGTAAKASFTYTDKNKSTRIEDLVVEGPGVLVKGIIELDQNQDIVLASFPTFALSDGDKATLRADRGTDGTMRVTMRGEVFDGRGFVKSAMSGSADKSKQPAHDVDLDIKLGAIAGHHGETMRGLELRMSRRAGQIRSFSLNGKLGRDAQLLGDMRAYPGGRQVIYLEANDAGSLFRFTDTYPRMYGGQMWVAMDPPTPSQTPQDGLLNVRDFTIRGEAALDRVVMGAAAPPGSERSSGAVGAGVQFTRMRVEFAKAPGRLMIRDGVVWGPAIGATIDGLLDYASDSVRMRGTFVPAYALNNLLARLPVVGLFMGGANEGLLGITYEVVGQPRTPVLRVNPVSAVMPGILRKMFEFRRTDEGTGSVPPGAPSR